MKKSEKKYRKSIIIISGDTRLIQEYRNNPLIYSYINKSSDFFKIVEKVNELIKIKEEEKNILNSRKKILKELKHLGYNISYKGTNYLRECIELMTENKERYFDNLKNDVYPIIAKRNNTTVHNIKCNINKATEQMYCECDKEILKNYFCFSDDIKPTVKTVIYTIYNKI